MLRGVDMQECTQMNTARELKEQPLSLADFGLSKKILVVHHFWCKLVDVNLNFVERIKQRRETDKLADHLRYEDYRRIGYLKAITVRLPVTTLAKLDSLDEEFEKGGGKLWSSRQETIFEMIESCIAVYINSSDSPEEKHEELQYAARRAMQINPPFHERDEQEGDERD
jgi:hypothetical protein